MSQTFLQNVLYAKTYKIKLDVWDNYIRIRRHKKQRKYKMTKQENLMRAEFGTTAPNEQEINTAKLRYEQIKCARTSIDHGATLGDHMNIQDVFERLDSRTYTIICKMFINANPDNLRFVNPGKYKLTESQVKNICIAAGRGKDMQQLFPNFVAKTKRR